MRSGSVLAAATLLFCATTFVVAEDPPPASGPEVGSRIPEFEARDQHGTLRRLANLSGPKGLMLLFHRTADW